MNFFTQLSKLPWRVLIALLLLPSVQGFESARLQRHASSGLSLLQLSVTDTGWNRLTAQQLHSTQISAQPLSHLPWHGLLPANIALRVLGLARLEPVFALNSAVVATTVPAFIARAPPC